MTDTNPDLNDVYRRIGELKGTVDSIHDAVVDPHHGVIVVATETRRRVESLERSRSRLWGMGYLLAAAAAWIGWEDAAKYFNNL